MKKFFPLLLAMLGFTLWPSNASAQIQDELAIGAVAPLADHLMHNIDGSFINLNQMVGKTGLVVIFSCNTCPFVVGNGTKSDGWEGRYNGLVKAAGEVGMNLVLVNSNEAKRANEDSFLAMRERATSAQYQMPYLVDVDHTLADAFGATKTPHVFLFDGELNLIYRGAIDDNVSKAAEVEDQYLLDAMAQHAAGERIASPTTRAIGCSIKRTK
jgi:hypothetical protein